MSEEKIIERIKFLDRNKQLEYILSKKNIPIQLDYYKNKKLGDKITFKVLSVAFNSSENDKFGQPYLENVKLVGEITKPLGLRNEIHGMKYKAKKRTKKTWTHQAKYTEIKIVAAEVS